MPDDLLRPAPPPEGAENDRPLLHRLGWFAALAAASLAATAGLAYVLRGLLFIG